jgi:hypothetical protein
MGSPAASRDDHDPPEPALLVRAEELARSEELGNTDLTARTRASSSAATRSSHPEKSRGGWSPSCSRPAIGSWVRSTSSQVPRGCSMTRCSRRLSRFATESPPGIWPDR